MNDNSKRIMQKKYSKDADLMFPLHKSDFDHPVREQFIKDLYNSQDFVPVKNKMESKYTESLSSLIDKLGFKDYVFVVLFSALLVGNFGFLYSDKLFHHGEEISSGKKLALNTISLAGIAILMIMGMYMGKAVIASIKQSNNELSVDKFYNRMTVRLFYKFKKICPELEESTLQHCNPEMARVIKTLMLANMSESDTLELYNIAKGLSEYKYTNLYKGKIDELTSREKSLKRALKIVEKTLINNPELSAVIMDVYKGKIPQTFVLQSNKQNVKE